MKHHVEVGDTWEEKSLRIRFKNCNKELQDESHYYIMALKCISPQLGSLSTSITSSFRKLGVTYPDLNQQDKIAAQSFSQLCKITMI